MVDIAVLLEDVHCHYQVYAQRDDSISGLLSRRLKQRSNVAVHALQGIDLMVYEGEVLGVIGHNGAGKSTLLKTISGSFVPTSGRVLVSSQPQKISVGWALNSQLSGRRNVELGLLGLGFDPAQASELEPGVIEFADIGDFIDLPLKSYSSGMRARLGFAIASASAPKILLMDEALAVGDRHFKERSIERVAKLRESAGTVIMASHSMSSVVEMCDRVLWIHDGKALMLGNPEEVVAAYDESVDGARNTIGRIKGGRVTPSRQAESPEHGGATRRANGKGNGSGNRNGPRSGKG